MKDRTGIRNADYRSRIHVINRLILVCTTFDKLRVTGHGEPVEPCQYYFEAVNKHVRPFRKCVQSSNLPGQAGQHTAGADLNKCFSALLTQAHNRINPSHAAIDLFNQI